MKEVNGFIIECDLQGTIVSVPSDPSNIIATPGSAATFSEITDRYDAEKSDLFIQTICAEGSAQDWQINTCYFSDIEPFYYAGTKHDDRLLIFGARHRGELSLLCINYFLDPSKLPTERESFINKVVACESCSNRRADLLYNEISGLNNELSNMYRDIARKNAELERLHETKNRFLGMAAHDLRSPLLSIDAFSGFIEEELSEVSTDEQKMFISRIRNNVSHMVNIINDFLTVSKIESGKLNLELTDADLKKILEDCVSTMQPLAHRSDKSIHLENGGSLPVMRLDASKMTQVFTNIISNAIDYSGAGDNILVSYEANDFGSVMVTIEDHGPGIPPETIERIFDFYERGASKGNKKGSGLGLAIASSVVEGHGGRITVESEPGKGSTFSIILPVK